MHNEFSQAIERYKGHDYFTEMQEEVELLRLDIIGSKDQHVFIQKAIRMEEINHQFEVILSRLGHHSPDSANEDMDTSNAVNKDGYNTDRQIAQDAVDNDTKDESVKNDIQITPRQNSPIGTIDINIDMTRVANQISTPIDDTTATQS